MVLCFYHFSITIFIANVHFVCKYSYIKYKVHREKLNLLKLKIPESSIFFEYRSRITRISYTPYNEILYLCTGIANFTVQLVSCIIMISYSSLCSAFQQWKYFVSGFKIFWSHMSALKDTTNYEWHTTYRKCTGRYVQWNTILSKLSAHTPLHLYIFVPQCKS